MNSSICTFVQKKIHYISVSIFAGWNKNRNLYKVWITKLERRYLIINAWFNKGGLIPDCRKRCQLTALSTIHLRSVKFRMNLWGHHFSQNANLKLQGFLSYHTNKDRSTLFGDFLVSVGCFFGYNSCLFGGAEILVILGLHFGRNDDLINSFWI